MSQIDEIRTRTDIVELIGALGVSLRKTGRSYVGFCPFHPNSRTPAFTVYPDTQSFYCFGCHAAGTAFDFVMRKQGVDFKAALEQLAARAGVRIEARGEADREEDARRTKLLEINTLAAKVFNHLLVGTPRGEPGRAYIAKRALSPASVETFQLGYCP
ncbi:MAG: CHC2 zinc finger domain-containing protein, partial [Chloroflexales bacterium]